MTTCRNGFTLIELLIAIAILAVIAALGYRAVSSLTDSEVQLTAEARRWQSLDALFARLESDMREALPRDARTDVGTEPAWLGDLNANGNAELRFSRAGPEFSIEGGSGGQRIGYRLRDDAVEILYWPRLDQPAAVIPAAYRLADGVAEFHIVYLDAAGNWLDRWPPPRETGLPRAVRVSMTLAGGGVVERWLALR